MKIGTPLSDTAIRVMLLGAGELGKEVAIELQRLGCEVIAVDRYANAPAMQVAHRSHVIPMTDPQVHLPRTERHDVDFNAPPAHLDGNGSVGLRFNRHLPLVPTHLDEVPHGTYRTTAPLGCSTSLADLCVGARWINGLRSARDVVWSTS